jgi:hypothetical protein
VKRGLGNLASWGDKTMLQAFMGKVVKKLLFASRLNGLANGTLSGSLHSKTQGIRS